MIPYGRQSIDEDDIKAVTDVLRGDYLTTGPAVAAFEKEFAKVTGAKEAVVCSNGTTALHLAVIALGLKEGDKAIVPSVTFLATANAIRFAGAEVVFADTDPDTGLMRPQDFEAALEQGGDAVKAVFPVHLTGQCVDLKRIKDIADQHDIKVVSDSCHAVGGTCRNQPVGSCAFADMETFSFHPVKTIAMGEGGAITTNNAEYAEIMRRMRTHGMSPKDMSPDIPSYYEMVEPGYNYRASDIHCALGLSQLKKLDRFVQRRQALVDLYDEKLKPLEPLVLPPARVQGCDPAWHLYAVRIDYKGANTTRAALMNALQEKGVGTQVHYLPVHQQPYYRERYQGTELPGADHYYDHTLSLPLYPDMSDEDVTFVVETLDGLIKETA